MCVAEHRVCATRAAMPSGAVGDRRCRQRCLQSLQPLSNQSTFRHPDSAATWMTDQQSGNIYKLAEAGWLVSFFRPCSSLCSWFIETVIHRMPHDAAWVASDLHLNAAIPYAIYLEEEVRQRWKDTSQSRKAGPSRLPGASWNALSLAGSCPVTAWNSEGLAWKLVSMRFCAIAVIHTDMMWQSCFSR